MKKAFLLKALVIIVPVLVALFAEYYDQKQQNKQKTYYKATCATELSMETDFYR